MDHGYQHGSAFVRVAIAMALVASLFGVAGIALVTTDHAASAATPTGTAIANAAASQAGIPYCGGGGGINGPSQPVNSNSTCAGGAGFDCMSLAQYAVYQVTGITVPPGDGTPVPGDGTFVPADGTTDLLPGDVVFFGGTSLDTYLHSGIYAGNGEVWDALTDGTTVREDSFTSLEADYQYVYWGAARYATSTVPPTTTTLPPTPSFGISTTTLADGTVSSRAHRATYAQTLNAFGGHSPYRWSLVTGALPPGLRLKTATGVIGGEAKSAGTFPFTVKVVDKRTKAPSSTQSSATRSFSITITPAA
jgi:hypothetical protein